jgi:DNA-binding transcriptional LysR family regulator
MLYSRAAVYFDEVARRGSIRQASETLNIAPSAIDRQVVQLEERIGVPLFERLPRGLRLTAAGEILIDTIRRGRRELERAEALIDNLRGLRRGRVTISVVEGAVDFLSRGLVGFHEAYPDIDFEIVIASLSGVIEALQSGTSEIGLTFNPPESHRIRVEQSLIYRIGAVVASTHRLVSSEELSLSDLCHENLIVPDTSLTLRAVLEKAWQVRVGEPWRAIVTANSISMMKASISAGIGVGVLTEMDVWDEMRNGRLHFIPFSDTSIPLSVLSVISLSGRTTSVSASLLTRHLSNLMASCGKPLI